MLARQTRAHMPSPAVCPIGAEAWAYWSAELEAELVVPPLQATTAVVRHLTQTSVGRRLQRWCRGSDLCASDVIWSWASEHCPLASRSSSLRRWASRARNRVGVGASRYSEYRARVDTVCHHLQTYTGSTARVDVTRSSLRRARTNLSCSRHHGADGFTQYAKWIQVI